MEYDPLEFIGIAVLICVAGISLKLAVDRITLEAYKRNRLWVNRPIRVRGSKLKW